MQRMCASWLLLLLSTLFMQSPVAENPNDIDDSVHLDDSACSFRFRYLSCVPSTLCGYSFQFGDVTLSQSCRILPQFRTLPQQLHLAIAGSEPGTGMTVSWATFNHVNDSSIWLGTTKTDLKEQSDVSIDSQSYYSQHSYSLYQYHVTLEDLLPSTTYYYKVGSESRKDWQSAVFSFRTAPSSAEADRRPLSIAIYGDHGTGALGQVTTDYVNSINQDLDLVVHLGDLAYADDAFLQPYHTLGFYYEYTYNMWMNDLTPLMAHVPYSVVVGNHEAECHSPRCQISSFKKDHLGNYTAFNARFRMPSKESGGAKNMYFSFDFPPIHWIMVSTETDYPNAPTNEYTFTHHNGHFGEQLRWLENDLAKADSNRGVVPWIVVAMHRPIYSLTGVDAKGFPSGDCANVQKSFEPLFVRFGVDLVVAGHEHAYERQLPVAMGQVFRHGVSDDNRRYVDVQAPVYVVSGSAGSFEKLDHDPGKKAAWNAAADFDHLAIGRLEVEGRDRLTWRLESSTDGHVLDEFVLIKTLQ